MKLTNAFRGFGMAAFAFFIGRAFIMGINPFAVGFLAAVCLYKESAWLVFAALMAGMSFGTITVAVAKYGVVFVIIMAVLKIKNSIFFRNKTLLAAFIVSSMIFLVDLTAGYIQYGNVEIIKSLVEASLTFSSTVIFHKGIVSIKEDHLKIAYDNEAALSVLALSATVLLGMPDNVKGIVFAQSFALFMLVFMLYKFGLGMGLLWAAVSSAVCFKDMSDMQYLTAWMIVTALTYIIVLFLDVGRLWFAIIFLTIYYLAGIGYYEMLLSLDSQKAVLSAILIFILAPNSMMLRLDDRQKIKDSGNSSEWGRLVIERVNKLADAFKRIEYTFSGESGTGIGFGDVGEIIEQFTNQIDSRVPINKTIEAGIIEELSARAVMIKDIFLVKNPDDRYEVYINARVGRGSLVTADTVKKIVEDKMKVKLVLKDESRSIVSRNYDIICMVEKPDFTCKTAVRRLSRYDEDVCGDNFYVGDLQDGQKLLLIADGMGNGEKAARDSENLIDSLEELLSAGFDKDMSIKVVNSYLAKKNKGESFSTLDMLLVDLYSGCGRLYKQGAATTFIKRGDWIELIKSTSLPVGIVEEAVCEKCMKKFYSGDIIVMVSDGLLESIVFENKEDYMQELILNSEAAEPDELAGEIVDDIKNLSGNRLKDDATIIVCKIVKSL